MNALAQIPAKTVTSGYRAIKDGSRYNQYFLKPEERDRVMSTVVLRCLSPIQQIHFLHHP